MQIIRRSVFLLALPTFSLLSGCVSYAPSVPEGYKGPVAIISDSVTPASSSKADFFFVSEIDGKRIEESETRTRIRNQGQGFNMIPAVVERNVPAQPATYTLIGRTSYAAPILALTGKVYEVTGKVSFSPESFKRYVVKGRLGPDYSGVWFEDATTGAVIGEKVELKSVAR